MSLREKCYEIAENKRFQNFILLLIIINAVTIGMETFDWHEDLEATILLADDIILFIFVIEIVVRLNGHRLEFFKDPWNNFDLIVVLASMAPSAGPLSVLRAFRVFRALRLISSMPEMQKMVESMIRSLRGIAAVSWLLGIVLYVFSVMATILFSDGGASGQEYFGNLGLSLYSLFQVMTLESWSNGIARMIIQEQGWWAAIFFISFIISTSFTFLNMFIAVFTNTMATIDFEESNDEGFSGKINEIKAEIEELKHLIIEIGNSVNSESE